MMNIVQLQNDLKDFSDGQLQQTMQTGSAPQYLVLAEMQRRQKMRQEMGGEAQAPETSVAEDIMAPPQAAQQSVPVEMAYGGLVSFANGGEVQGENVEYIVPEMTREQSIAAQFEAAGRRSPNGVTAPKPVAVQSLSGGPYSSGGGLGFMAPLLNAASKGSSKSNSVYDSEYDARMDKIRAQYDKAGRDYTGGMQARYGYKNASEKAIEDAKEADKPKNRFGRFGALFGAYPQFSSYADGGKVSAYQKGMAEACWQNPETGKKECPEKRKMIEPNTKIKPPSKSKEVDYGKYADGIAAFAKKGFAEGGSVQRLQIPPREDYQRGMKSGCYEQNDGSTKCYYNDAEVPVSEYNSKTAEKYRDPSAYDAETEFGGVRGDWPPAFGPESMWTEEKPEPRESVFLPPEKVEEPSFWSHYWEQLNRPITDLPEIFGFSDGEEKPKDEKIDVGGRVPTQPTETNAGGSGEPAATPSGIATQLPKGERNRFSEWLRDAGMAMAASDDPRMLKNAARGGIYGLEAMKKRDAAEAEREAAFALQAQKDAEHLKRAKVQANATRGTKKAEDAWKSVQVSMKAFNDAKADWEKTLQGTIANAEEMAKPGAKAAIMAQQADLMAQLQTAKTALDRAYRLGAVDDLEYESLSRQLNSISAGGATQSRPTMSQRIPVAE